MSTRNNRVVAGVLALFSMACYADDLPSLGEPVNANELVMVDYTVMIDGSGLPAGGGNAADGGELYRQHCMACHGEDGSGGINDDLVGGRGSLKTKTPVQTVGSYWPYATTLFDYIRRAMPYPSPGILTNDEIYAVTAYVLYLNDIIESHDVVDARTLAGIEMPNRDNFVWAESPE